MRLGCEGDFAKYLEDGMKRCFFEGRRRMYKGSSESSWKVYYAKKKKKVGMHLLNLKSFFILFFHKPVKHYPRCPATA